MTVAPKRFAKDHFNLSSYEVVGIYYNGLKGEHNISIAGGNWE